MTEISKQPRNCLTFDPSTWLLEEYKLLCDQYKHEDSQYLQTVMLFTTVNSALLAFLGSSFAVRNPSVAIQCVPLSGFVICLAWFAAMIRLREWRSYIEDRVTEIERDLHRIWGETDPYVLDIRTFRRWDILRPPSNWHDAICQRLRNVPWSLTLCALPILFAIIWIVVGITNYIPR